jgi:hypothetical protein
MHASKDSLCCANFFKSFYQLIRLSCVVFFASRNSTQFPTLTMLHSLYDHFWLRRHVDSSRTDVYAWTLLGLVQMSDSGHPEYTVVYCMAL